MRIIGLVLLSLVLLSRASDDDPHVATRHKCRDELSLTDETLRDAMQDPKDMGCYLFCFFKELSMMDEKGEYYPDNAVDAIEDSLREAAKTYIYACYELSQKIDEQEPCARAYAMVDCFKTRAPDLYGQLGLFQPPAKVSGVAGTP